MRRAWLTLVFIPTSLIGQHLESYTDSVPGTMVSFTMVPVPGGQAALPDGTAEVDAFWIGETEVVWELYDVFALRLDVPRSERLSVDAEARPSRPYGAPDHGFGHRGYAALSMTYHAAVTFCAWLSDRTGHNYRLPTDAEWSRAVQADLVEGGGWSLDEVAWYRANSSRKTHPVGSRQAGQLGLYDMIGNAAEWVTGLNGPLARGGSHLDPAEVVGPDRRAEQEPFWNATDPQIPKSRWWLSDGTFIGFRIVRVP